MKKQKKRQSANQSVVADLLRNAAREESRAAALRQNLLVLAGHDQSLADRLIQCEAEERKRKGLPAAGLAELTEEAIGRWRRDHR